MFLAVSLLDNRSLSIILMIELFLCNKYLSFYHGSGQIFCFCWLCLFSLVGASASDSPSSFLFLSSLFFWMSFFFFGLYVFLFLCVCVCVSVCVVVFLFPSSCFFSFSCVSFSSWPMLFLFGLALFPASLHVSRLIVLVVVVFLLIAPLSHLVLFLLPRPPRALERKTMEETYFILFAFRGSLRICPFTESLFLFFFRWFLSSTEHVFVSCSWPMFWWSDGFFVASYFSLFCVWVFGAQPSFGPTCLLCLHCLDLLSSFLEFFFFWCFFCLSGVFFVGFWFVSFQCSSSSWDSLSLIVLSWCCFSTSCLGCSFVCVCVFLGCLLRGTIPESRMGMANREGSIYFSGFLIIGVFGWKQPLSPRATLFSKLLSLKNAHLSGENGRPFSNFVAGNALKIGVPEFFCRNIRDPRLFTFLIF